MCRVRAGIGAHSQITYGDDRCHPGDLMSGTGTTPG
jgi:hypothetical protein